MKAYLYIIKYTSKKIIFLKIMINIFILIIYLFYNTSEIYYNYKIYNVELINNSFNLYHFNYSGKLEFLHLKEKNFNNITSNDSDFLIDLEILEKGIDFAFLKVEKTKIENIIILLLLFPFLKKNSSIFYQIKNKKDYNLYKEIFKVKNKKFIYNINKNDLYFLIHNFNNSIYYNWEIIFENELINKLRYIINNYYNETFIKIFDNSLNLNFKRHIKKIRNNLTINKISILMSKLLL